ncbi:MAG: flagellar biosynthesis anti-sigma factor FlgM [Acidobacteriota bacterium]
MEIDGKSPLIDLGARLNRLDMPEPRASRLPNAGRDLVTADHDRIEISVRSREFQHLDDLIQSIPDVREARVQEIRLALERGTYNVRAEQVADKIIGGLLLDETS